MPGFGLEVGLRVATSLFGTLVHVLHCYLANVSRTSDIRDASRESAEQVPLVQAQRKSPPGK